MHPAEDSAASDSDNSRQVRTQGDIENSRANGADRDTRTRQRREFNGGETDSQHVTSHRHKWGDATAIVQLMFGKAEKETTDGSASDGCQTRPSFPRQSASGRCHRGAGYSCGECRRQGEPSANDRVPRPFQGKRRGTATGSGECCRSHNGASANGAEKTRDFLKNHG